MSHITQQHHQLVSSTLHIPRRCPRNPRPRSPSPAEEPTAVAEEEAPTASADDVAEDPPSEPVVVEDTAADPDSAPATDAETPVEEKGDAEPAASAEAEGVAGAAEEEEPVVVATAASAVEEEDPAVPDEAGKIVGSATFGGVLVA